MAAYVGCTLAEVRATCNRTIFEKHFPNKKAAGYETIAEFVDDVGFVMELQEQYIYAFEIKKAAIKDLEAGGGGEGGAIGQNVTNTNIEYECTTTSIGKASRTTKA